MRNYHVLTHGITFIDRKFRRDKFIQLEYFIDIVIPTKQLRRNDTSVEMRVIPTEYTLSRTESSVGISLYFCGLFLVRLQSISLELYQYFEDRFMQYQYNYALIYFLFPSQLPMLSFIFQCGLHQLSLLSVWTPL